MATDRSPRPRAGDGRRRSGDAPSRPRTPPKRARVSAALALAAVLVALVVGLLIGYAAAGDPAPAGLVTDERAVPVVTVTVPAEP